MINKLRSYTDNTNFANAFKATVACALPVVILSYFDHFQQGLSIAIGALLAYPSDVPGSLSHKVKGILLAVFLISIATLVLGLIPQDSVFIYPVLLLALFFMSMISVYGYRAGMISFVVLIGITLSFSHSYSGSELLKHCGLLLIGGLFYLVVSLLFNYFRPYRYAELLIADCLKLTSLYLKRRGDLWNVNADREKIIERQLELQVEINATHEKIREFLIRNTVNTTNSGTTRTLFIVFSNLVEMLEIALSFSFNHNDLHQKFANHPKTLKTYQQLAYGIAETLKKLSLSLQINSSYSPDTSLEKAYERLEKIILRYQTEIGTTASEEGLLMLRNMQHYAEKQMEKIKMIEKALTGSMQTEDFNRKHKDIEKFLTPQNYRINTLLENLSFSSTTFRHSLRLSVTIMAGFVIGKLLPLQNVYWILLTIVVIMRPGYGLTKQRSFERIFGTVIGGVIAFGMLFFIDNTYLLSLFSVIAMILGFAYSQTNYKIGATFVTMYVIFIFGMFTPNVTEVVQYRILDTLIGALLAFLGNYFLWPSWEFLNSTAYLEKSITANKIYLREITDFYNRKGEVTVSYKLARKQAFIETGNLMASFQRMKQEPKSKQKNMSKVYKIVVLNHTLLSAAASLGTYVQSHKTTTASEAFNIVAGAIIRNLERAVQAIIQKNPVTTLTLEEKERLALSFSELKKIRSRELKATSLEDQGLQFKMEEAQLVIDQLLWLFNLSEALLKAAQSIDLQNKNAS